MLELCLQLSTTTNCVRFTVMPLLSSPRVSHRGTQAKSCTGAENPKAHTCDITTLSCQICTVTEFTTNVEESRPGQVIASARLPTRHCYTWTLLHINAFTHNPFYTKTLLHTDPFTHRDFYTQTHLHTVPFTHRPFYTQTLLHTNTCTHQVIASARLPTRPCYTWTLSQKETLLHTNPCRHKHIDTQTLLHTNTFTQNHSHTQSLLHTDRFTHRPSYTQTH